MALSISGPMTPERGSQKLGPGIDEMKKGFSKLSLEKLRDRRPAPHQPAIVDFEAELSVLERDLAMHSKQASDLHQGEYGILASFRTSTGDDSGYASLASTPQTSKDTDARTDFTAARLSTSKLKVFPKAIPDDLRDRFIDLKMLYSDALWKAI